MFTQFPFPFIHSFFPIRTNNPIEHLRHIHSIQRIAQLSIIMSRPHSRNHRDFIRKMFLSRDPLRFLHQKRSIAFMLELRRASRMHRNRRPVHVQFSHNTHISLQFLAEHIRSTPQFPRFHPTRPSATVATQSKCPSPDLRTTKTFPSCVSSISSPLPAICRVIASNQLHLRRLNLLVDVLNPHFPHPNIPAHQPLHFIPAVILPDPPFAAAPTAADSPFPRRT